nr:hypothetical protein [Tanacetum cinerariifolium]
MVNKFVYEETAKKKKKSQSADEVANKGKEDEKVDMFYKEDGLYKVLRNVRDGSVVCSRFKGHGEEDVVQESVNVQEGGVVAQEFVDVQKEGIDVPRRFKGHGEGDVVQESVNVQEGGVVAQEFVDEEGVVAQESVEVQEEAESSSEDDEELV